MVPALEKHPVQWMSQKITPTIIVLEEPNRSDYKK